MSYQFVYDKEQVIRYAKLFIADINENPYFTKYVFLASRRKYNPSVGLHEKSCFFRKVVRDSDPEAFYSVLRSYEVPYDALDSVPQDSLVIYCCINPRSMIKGYMDFKSKVEKSIEQIMVYGSNSSLNIFKKLETKLKSSIHASIAEKKYIELDVDTKDEEKVKRVWEIIHEHKLEKSTICTIETRGGYHIVFDNISLGKIGRTKLWKEFNSDEWKYEGENVKGMKIIKLYVELRNDPTQPVPGTYQGGFKVRFVD
jgi:hypothetical protein